ncbi:hypothetical protein QJS10_CPA01g01746 [Acorus calamus]|uniref:Uncharacterized protein n=1 Tax=Acorus calamus TaxID=4465 RepID=A0AAV9FQ93_ACOCL|nr:hypothetical protein QJS10_CPA01g01746 [Acorus calamus]
MLITLNQWKNVDTRCWDKCVQCVCYLLRSSSSISMAKGTPVFVIQYEPAEPRHLTPLPH